MLNRIKEDELIMYFDKQWILQKANSSMKQVPVSITDVNSELSPGTNQDYYSNADYWWPNPDTDNGLPYIRRDGESNPDNFSAHRFILRNMRTHVANLAAGYLLTGDENYAKTAVRFFQRFFIDQTTRMNPHLLYAQAIPGICTGRGIGIIDTLHLIDVPIAVEKLRKSQSLSDELIQNLKKWFGTYLEWMSTHPFGLDEMNAENNHSVCWYVQAAAYAWFTENKEMLEYCRKQYKTVLLTKQMALDGSFPRELTRTKPYGYSIFVLDNMVTLCHILSTPEDNLWDYKLEDGRGIRKGVEYLYPFIKDKNKWPHQADIEHYEGWPARISSLLFAGLALDENKYIKLWEKLDPDPTDMEIRRNIAIRQPILWI